MATRRGQPPGTQEKGSEMKEINVLVVRPGELPEKQTLTDDLHTYQSVVGGYIEGLIDEDFTMYVNEEGLINGLPLNLEASLFIKVTTGKAVSIHGTAIILGPPDSEGNDTSVLPQITENITLKEN